MNKKELFISCGDPSGDIHASNLAKEIKRLSPEIRITSIGGKEIQKVSDNFLYNIVDLHLHGFWEPVRQYFNLRKFFNKTIISYLKNTKPTAVIPVDFYGFNINLSKKSKLFNIPVYYYISPQVWATRYSRIKKLKKYIDHIFVIFPFEEEIYRRTGIPVDFVGHPLLDIIPQNFTEQPKNNNKNKYTIGIFPGSRKPVVKWNLPVMLKTAKIIKEKFPQTEIVIFGLENLKDCYKEIDSFPVVYDRDYEARKKIDLSITTSGTVTLENALLGIPMIVTYKLPWPMYFLIKSMISISTITIVNLIVKENIVPEFIQKEAKPEKIAEKAISWLSEPKLLNEIKNKLIETRKKLGEIGSYERTAKILLSKIN